MRQYEVQAYKYIHTETHTATHISAIAAIKSRSASGSLHTWNAWNAIDAWESIQTHLALKEVTYCGKPILVT